MTKRRITAILSALFVVAIVCLEEWVTIKIGNPNNVGKIIAGAIYIYLAIYLYIDVIHVLNSENNCYLVFYHALTFVRDLAIMAAVNVVLIIIFYICINNETMNYLHIIQLIVAGILEGIACCIAHKYSMKCWELYKKEKDLE